MTNPASIAQVGNFYRYQLSYIIFLFLFRIWALVQRYAGDRLCEVLAADQSVKASPSVKLLSQLTRSSLDASIPLAMMAVCCCP